MLISKKTNLKSLKFGNTDKPGGKALNDNEKEPGKFAQQPYIRTNIPTNGQKDGYRAEDDDVYGGPGILGTGGPDIIIRGGALSVTRSVKDVSRLTQMFADTTNGARGIQYTVKENILSRTSVRTEASEGPLNQGTYLPTSTIAQAGVNAFGGHLNHLGLLPFDNVPGTVPKYENVFNNIIEGKQGINTNINTNRLVGFFQEFNEINYFNRPSSLSEKGDKIISFNNPILYSYPGGPGSDLGIGNTNIFFSDKKVGKRWDGTSLEINSLYSIKPPNGPSLFSFDPTGNSETGKYADLNIEDKKDKNIYSSAIFEKGRFNSKGISPSFLDGVGLNDGNRYNDNQWSQLSLNLTSSNQLDKDQINKIDSISQKDVKNGGGKLNPSDFRKDLESFKESIDTGTSKVLSLSPAYNDFNKNIHGRVNLGDPGNPQDKNVWNYSADNLEALDKITSSEITTKNGGDEYNDLVQFRIAVIGNPNTVSKKDGKTVTQSDSTQYMYFRAFIDSFSDNYTATWNPVNYVGRGDTLYNYGNFGRTVNMSFTVAAQSKPELIPMYNKLNYLASTLAPDYSDSGFMMGNIIQLTVGNYVRRQHGFISSLTYDVPQESPWEIAIKSDWEEFGNRGDSTVKELPHVIKASFSFTPIHNFLPQKAQGNPNNPPQKFIKQ